MIGSVKVASIPSRNVSESKYMAKDVPKAKKFQSKGCHEWWQIELGQARETIPKTTQRITRSAVITLARRYKLDIVFPTKVLTGMWDTYTMDRRVKSLDSNHYAQAFFNMACFYKLYTMAKKADSGHTLKMFVIELGVPE